MDAVKQLFLCVVESSRYAAAAARYCAYIIEVIIVKCYQSPILREHKHVLSQVLFITID